VVNRHCPVMISLEKQSISTGAPWPVVCEGMLLRMVPSEIVSTVRRGEMNMLISSPRIIAVQHKREPKVTKMIHEKYCR
jgi:hypothetical protein